MFAFMTSCGSGFVFRLPAFGFRAQGFEFRFSVEDQGLQGTLERRRGTPSATARDCFRVSGFGFRVSGLGFRVSGLGFRVSGSGFRVSSSVFWVKIWDWGLFLCWSLQADTRTCISCTNSPAGLEGELLITLLVRVRHID